MTGMGRMGPYIKPKTAMGALILADQICRSEPFGGAPAGRRALAGDVTRSGAALLDALGRIGWGVVPVQLQPSPGHDPTGAVTPVGEPTSTAPRVDGRDDLDGAVTPSGEPMAAVPSCGGQPRPEPQQPANAESGIPDSRDSESGAAVGEQGTGEPGGGVVSPAGRPPHGRFRHAVARVALAVYYWGIRSPRKAPADRAEYIRVLTLTVAYQAAWAARHGINFRTFIPEVYAAFDEIEGGRDA